jgi:GTP-binding protein
MLDDELKTELKKEVPENIPFVFISSITNQGLMELKDLIWRELH